MQITFNLSLFRDFLSTDWLVYHLHDHSTLLTSNETEQEPLALVGNSQSLKVRTLMMKVHGVTEACQNADNRTKYERQWKLL